MTGYSIIKEQDGTIKFRTDNEELRSCVIKMIECIADAISYRNQIERRYETTDKGE